MSPVKSYSQEQTTSGSVENVMSDTSTRLTQQISQLPKNDDISRFPIPNGTILFYPGRKYNLYKVSILEHDLVSSKVKYLQWGPNYNEWVCSKSIWAYSQFTQLLSTVKKIPKDLSARIDELVRSATLGSGSSGPSDNPSKLPDLKTICSKNIPTIRYMPVKFRIPWYGIITSIIEDCISNADCVENWRKFFAVSKCVSRASNRGGKKHKQQQENSMMNRFERWRSGEYAALWYEAASIKQAKNKSNSRMEALAFRAKTRCLRGQFGRAAKILSSEGTAPDNRKTLIELKKLHPEENEILEPLEEYSCEAYQFDEGKVFLQLQSSKFTAAGPFKMYPEHLLHAINCSISDQSKRAMNSLTKLVNLASRGQIPSFVALAFCSATLTALNKKKTGIRPIAVVEVIRLLFAKCIAKEAAIEAVELFGSKQLGVAVKGGAESSHLLGSTKVLMPSIMSFASF